MTTSDEQKQTMPTEATDVSGAGCAAPHGSELPTREGVWQRGDVRVSVQRIGAARCTHSYLIAVFPLGNGWDVTQLAILEPCKRGKREGDEKKLKILIANTSITAILGLSVKQ